MYGTNPIAKRRSQADGFLVHSMFYTIQGEGPFAGVPAIFLRLAGCNLRCHWCDTEFDAGAQHYTTEALLDALADLKAQYRCELIVLTGGEPMLQPLPLLIDAYHRRDDFRFFNTHWQIETAGSVWPDGGFPPAGLGTYKRNYTIVCSPKTPRVCDQFDHLGSEIVYWKYIIKAGEIGPDGLPIVSTQRKGDLSDLYRPAVAMSSAFLRSRRIFVQACDEGDPVRNKLNEAAAAQSAMQHGYRLSVQIHKIFNLQ